MAKLDFSPIADTTRRAEIVALLRRAILTGQLEPGQKLNELRISEQMRVSRAPLREAMRELVQEGILTSIPYAGTFVIDVTAKDIEDAYSLNKVLDEFAIERSWPLRDERFFEELDRRHEAVKQATRDRDTTRQIETALQLHGLIYEWADNAVLLDTWQRLTSRLQMYFALHQRARNEVVPAEDVHETYVRLLKGADMGAAQRHAESLGRHGDQGDGDDGESCLDPAPVPGEPQGRNEKAEPRKTIAHEARLIGFVAAARRLHHDIDGHLYPFREPLVEGTASGWRGSVSSAARRARATALKQVSAIWWLLAP